MVNCILGVYDGYNSLDTHKGGLRIFASSFRTYNKEDNIICFVQKKMHLQS